MPYEAIYVHGIYYALEALSSDLTVVFLTTAAQRIPYLKKTLVISFLLKQWLLIFSAVGFLLTSAFNRHFPGYSIQEIEILFLLYALFISIKGLQQSGIITGISRSLEKGGFIPLKLILAAFFFSMLVTNDVALIILVPLTLELSIDRKDLLIIGEALAVNGGSALTPFGNPQNLFIYWFYHLDFSSFIASIWPFTCVFLIIMTALSLAVRVKGSPDQISGQAINKKHAVIHSLLLSITLLIVLHVLPTFMVLIIIGYGLFFDRQALRVDYALLISFFFFFGLADNLKTMLAMEIQHSRHIFILSALASQVISNVPAALLFARFTSNWHALLWGTSVGGFGSLFGSLANLIAYKLYLNHETSVKPGLFTIKFLFIGYIAFFIGAGLFFVLQKT